MAAAGTFAKTFGAAGLFALALTAGQSVGLADGMSRGSVKDMPMPASPWQGFYIGTRAALVAGNTQGSTPFIDTDYEVTGALAGAHVGYNWQRGSYVFGVEGTYDYSNVQGTTNCTVGPFDISCKRSFDWLATAGGRLGMVFGNTLYYSTVGAAWTELKTRISGDLDQGGNSNRVGWTAGFGFEHALSDRVFARIEYAHVDLGSKTQTNTGDGADYPDKVKLEFDTIRVGVTLKLSN